jgi:hypothetical protein
MVDIRSLVSQIPMEPGYVPAPPEPDLSVIQRLIGLPQTLRAVGQNLAVGAASLPYGIYQGFGNPAAGEAAMSQFQQEYGYTPTNPAAQQQLQGLGEFLQQLETEYKIPPIMAPVAATPALGIRGMVPQTERLARDLVSEIQTTPPTGAVQLAPAPGLLEKSDIGFYSQLEAAVQPLQNKGTGQQYLAQIQKSAGVKPDEIQWTGLDEFLKSKQSVTKQEIQDYLQANRVDVQEVQLGGTMQEVGINPDSPYAIPEVLDVFQREADAGEGFRVSLANDYDAYMALERNFPDLLEQDEWADIVADSLFPNRQDVRPTKFSQFTLPGGENYREILLTLPEDSSKIRNQLDALDAEAKRLSDAGDPRWREVSAQRGELLRQQSRGTYRSSHFDQPNILAHLRVNDRTVDGKKTLFVEEIQSDWHQAGRKRGYLTPSSRSIRDIENEASEVNRERARLINEAADLPDSRMDEFNVMNAKIQELTVRARELGDEFDAAMRPKDNVPDAPFKTSWHELSLKRAIQEAAEKGYDQIAFTTGKTQAERYDLSKQVNKIDVEAVEEVPNLYFADVYVAGRGKAMNLEIENGFVRNDEFAGKPLEEVVGKEIAEKILSVEQGKTQRLTGDDLRIGGEGMKGFYDNILPKSLDKLGKKFGAKVGKTFIEGERTRDASGIPSMYPEKIEVWQMDITPQMRESVVTKGQPLFAIPAIGAGLLGAGMMQEEETY